MLLGRSGASCVGSGADRSRNVRWLRFPRLKFWFHPIKSAARFPVSRPGEAAAPVELVVPPLKIDPIAVPDVEIPTSPVPAGRNSQ